MTADQIIQMIKDRMESLQESSNKSMVIYQLNAPVIHELEYLLYEIAAARGEIE